MKQLLIISGKGGTGKTTVAAAFIALAKARACADCDVDAPNLHFVLDSVPVAETEAFYGMDVASIQQEDCDECGLCRDHCRFGAILEDGQGKGFVVNTPACEGGGVCEVLCPQKAITMVTDQAGDMTLHASERQIFSTAQLKMGKGNSGLLVTQVKKRMVNNLLPETSLAIIDGSPGIGCPVIASLNGVDMVLLVVEPTLSGISDMERIVATAKRSAVPIGVCVNRSTMSKEYTERIATICHELGLHYLGEIPYDAHVVQAINSGRTIMEFDCPASQSLRDIFTKTLHCMQKEERFL